MERGRGCQSKASRVRRRVDEGFCAMGWDGNEVEERAGLVGGAVSPCDDSTLSSLRNGGFVRENGMARG